ncbi:MAG TPA: lipid II flippase MurJ, partial [Chloroflexia bacterium]|nr:lipid II flippase MurJ [Chloroflexia bacterium]
MLLRLPAQIPALLGARAGWARLYRLTLLLIGLAALNNLLGYARDIILAAWFGASRDSDAYFVGSFVPLLVYQVVVVGSLIPAVLPVLAQTGGPDASGEAARARLVRGLLLGAGGLGLALVAGLWLAAPGLVAAIAPGLERSAAGQASAVLRWSLPLVLFVLPAGVLTAALNYQGRFMAPALGLAASNACVVLALGVAGPRYGVLAAAAGLALGGLLNLAIVATGWGILDLGFGILDWGRFWGPGAGIRKQFLERRARRPQSQIPNPKSQIPAGLARTGQLAVPLLVTVSVVQVVAVVERFLGSRLAPGSLSLLAYAMKLNLLSPLIVAGTLTTLIFPTLARHASPPPPTSPDPNLQARGLGVGGWGSG